MRIRRILSFILLVTLVCTLSVPAFADGTTITTTVPGVSVSVSAGEHGGFTVLGAGYRGEKTFFARTEQSFAVQFTPDWGYEIDELTVSGMPYGMNRSGTYVSFVPGEVPASLEVTFKELEGGVPEIEYDPYAPGSTVSIPFFGLENSLLFSCIIQNGTVLMKRTESAKLDGLIGSSVHTGPLGIGLDSLPTDIRCLILPADVVNAIAAAAADPNNDTTGIAIYFTDGCVFLNAAALLSITAQAVDSEIAFLLDSVGTQGLSETQRRAVSRMEVTNALEISVSSGGQFISDLGGGRVRVTVPHGAETDGGIAVYCAMPDGALVKLPSTSADGSTDFTVYHLSNYVVTAGNPEPVFTDVRSGAYYSDAVRWAASGSITTGSSETLFAPNAVCTRAEAVTFLWRLAGSPAPEKDRCGFTDLKKDSYYYEAVLWAAEKGITLGTGRTDFSPNAPITRAQAVTLLSRFLHGAPADGRLPFADVSSGRYYYAPVLWAWQSGVTTGTAKDAFNPNAACTRAQFIAFLYRSAVQ